MTTQRVAGREHGGSGATYVHYGCRCDECRQANTARVNRRRAERFASRVLVDGRLVAPGPRQHGKQQTYSNWGCRCEPCDLANRESCNSYRTGAATQGRAS